MVLKKKEQTSFLKSLAFAKGSLRRAKGGQLSIFALLLFPTLFILFAMSLNIALVVHDKINLQNSVDIAAYYGAMKQAEMLNAIAHINYQIRQSWKLLTWRYRVLGSMGLTYVPANWRSPLIDRDVPHILPVYHRSRPVIYGPYFFCLGHFYWEGFIDPASGSSTRITSSDTSDLLCVSMEQTISELPTPRIVSGVTSRFSSKLGGIVDFTIRQNNLLKKKCSLYGFHSWLLGALSFAHFHQDQSDRKQMMFSIAKALMAGKGKDLDNSLIQDGVEKTLKKNLSFTNNKALGNPSSSLEQFSSLEGKQVNDLLKDPAFYVYGLYSKLEGDGGGCTKNWGYVNQIYSNTIAGFTLAPSADLIQGIMDRLPSDSPSSSTFNNWPNCGIGGSCAPSAGMAKNKNLIVYYGVKAELEYKNQIFLPFDITLKAQAFAKPFGGRIGPPINSSNLSIDGLLPQADSSRPPPRLSSLGKGGIQEIDEKYSPNYSRYPGDTLGLRSKLVHFYWAQHVQQNSGDGSKSIKNYLKLEEAFDDKDPMPRNWVGGGKGIGIKARKWEIAAIAPDLFDVTYFTILPHYHYDYFRRLAKDGGILGRKPFLRGDLGTYCKLQGTGSSATCPNKASEFLGPSMLKQLTAHYRGNIREERIWDELSSSLYPLRRPVYNLLEDNPNLLLTGWNPPKQKYASPFRDNYEDINQTSFGDCKLWVHDAASQALMRQDLTITTKGKIANGCIFGGRTGYSVKMIHPDIVQRYYPSTHPGTRIPPTDWFP